VIHAWIQAHPKRVDLREDLIASLKGLRVRVSEHESDPPSPWKGYRTLLERALPPSRNGDHLLILQDDVEVAPNFVPAIRVIAKANPETPVVLFLAYLPRKTASNASRMMILRKPYVDMYVNDFCPVVGMLWPRHKAQEMYDWAGHSPLPGDHNARSDDAVVGAWMRRTRQHIRATVPSIVQHPDMVESLIGRRHSYGKDRGRVALFFAEDAAQYDFSVSS
jgi:hypothetical protein